MDIISQLKEERAKIAGQLNALDTAITALSGRSPRRITRTSQDERIGERRFLLHRKRAGQKQRATRLSRSKPASDVFQQRD